MNSPRLWVFVGPDKTGSTWLQLWAEAHPQIRHCTTKELQFFDSRRFERGADWYLTRFAQNPADGPLLQVWHDYLFSPEAAARIGSWPGEVGLVVGVRHPADRAYSSYQYMLKQGRTRASFSNALETIPELADHGRLMTHLSRFIWARPSIPVAILDFEQLGSDPEALSQALATAIGVGPFDLPAHLMRPVNHATRSRTPRLVKAMRAVAHTLRRSGLYKLETNMKRRILRSNVLFAPVEQTLSKDDVRHMVRDKYPDLSGEYAQLDERFGTDFHSRWFAPGPASG